MFWIGNLLFNTINMKKAFTLIELIVVIAIISLLASVALSSFGSARQKARDSAKIQSLQEIRNALQLYFTDNGFYPGGNTIANLTSALVNGPKRYIGAINSNIKYQGTNIDNTATCASNCPSYHIGIALEKTNNVLIGDKDINIGFPGLSADCITAGATDLCYDITP